MKKTILIATLVLSGFLFGTAQAQLKVSVKANIGTQPVWGPTGYDHVDYYYLPDIDSYYDVQARQYVYKDHGHWLRGNSLPGRYHDYDVYKGYKIVVNDPYPYRHAETYRTKYGEFKGRHNKELIRDSHESKYFENKDHPEHDKWVKDHKRQNDDHNNRKYKS